MFKVGQKVRWTSYYQRYEGTVIAADDHGTTTTQDKPSAPQTWHHGPNANLELVDS
jgi:hypothetical protein